MLRRKNFTGWHLWRTGVRHTGCWERPSCDPWNV